jgi:hypothetical protein
VYDYTKKHGSRKFKPLKAFLEDHMPDFSERITKGEKDMIDAQEQAEKKGLPMALFFTSKSKTPPVVKFLSTEFRRSLLVLDIPPTYDNQELMEEYGLSSDSPLPALVVVPVGGANKTSLIPYTGDDFTVRSLQDFLSEHALLAREPELSEEPDLTQICSPDNGSFEDFSSEYDFPSHESFPFDAMTCLL